MILSRTSQYAIQAMVLVAMQPPGTMILNRDIALRLNVPRAYMAKIMQALSKGELIRSTRGRLGGFYLPEGFARESLLRIIAVTEGEEFTQTCVLGLKECADETACPLHCRWGPIRRRTLNLLRTLTLAKLARAVRAGRYRLADIPCTVAGDESPLL